MEQTLMAACGGEEGVRELVRIFYALIEEDPVLRPLFPPSMEEPLHRQTLYFIEFFGGPALYTESYGKPFLRFKHRHVVIGPPERDAWLNCLSQAMDKVGLPSSVTGKLQEKIIPIADFMMNAMPGVKDAHYFNTPESSLS